MPGADFVLDKGLLAQTALSKYRAVKFGTVDESCTVATAVDSVLLGIVQHAVAAADANKQVADVRLMGVTKWEASAAITRGNLVTNAADGRAAPIAGAAGSRAHGQALSSAAAAGDIIDVLLMLNGQTSAAAPGG